MPPFSGDGLIKTDLSTIRAGCDYGLPEPLVYIIRYLSIANHEDRWTKLSRLTDGS